MKHLLVLVLFAFVVAVVFGIVSRDTTKARLVFGAKVFLEFVGIGIALGWVLYFLPL